MNSSRNPIALIVGSKFELVNQGANIVLCSWLFIGKQIVGLQATLAQLENGPKRKPQADTFGREPFQHPALERVEILADNFRQRKLHSRHVGELAHRYGLHEVLRWLPWVVCHVNCSPIFQMHELSFVCTQSLLTILLLF